MLIGPSGPVRSSQRTVSPKQERTEILLDDPNISRVYDVWDEPIESSVLSHD
ncbi:hypothetical protein G9A89_020541 [Geosiphon pyriformis]|nr:hypothetical protein G9A89_020541 [Geosiphon pyriformis]